MIALRDRVHAVVDDRIHEDQADVTVTMRDGRKHHLFVEHAIGSMERPMSDDDLARKFHGLVDPVLGAARARRPHRTVDADHVRRNLLSLVALARPA